MKASPPLSLTVDNIVNSISVVRLSGGEASIINYVYILPDDNKV
ncbi:hypothetical protein SAMN05444267_101217 [Chryseobacterium polytrichastri]|uniref:Uncharacterized protein n=1 Tax=Chryseobacterium polytrichastri TaxID=1302687 RepID=A0A1M6XX15_9FLAO|nr:hypothetical protein SAMN05444267_101217 [Chryseobacterium polytrichastri]